MVQGVHPGRPGQGMGILTLAGPSAQSLPPLVGLPEPEKLPTGDDVVDLPEEVLCESERSMRAAAGRKIWVWMAIVGFVSWGALAMVFLGSLTPLFLFLPIFAIADPSFVASLLNGLGASPGVVLFIAFGSAPLGALAGLGAAALGLRSVARLRPREYLTEKEFRRAIGWSFAKWILWPELAVIVLSMILTALPGNTFILADFSYIVVSGYLQMFVIALLSAPLAAGLARASNPLKLPGLGELEMRRQAAIGTDNYGHYTRVLFAQDRRHLPRNRFIANPRVVAQSFRTIARYRWWQVLTVAVLVVPFYYFADFGQLFTFDGNVGDISGATDFSLTTRIAALVLLVAWLSAFAWLPPLVLSLFHLIPPSKRGVRDQRTYPTIAERMAVNRWERGVVWVTTLGLAAVEAVCLIALLVVLQVTGDAALAGPVHLWVLGISGFAASALGMIATYRAMAIDLRTIVYGPAGWYMRREVPFSAIAPQRGTRTDLADDPRVRAALRERQAMKLGLPKDATLEQIAKAASRTGVLPDFGLGEEQVTPVMVDPPTIKGEHDIPESLEELHAGRLTV